MSFGLYPAHITDILQCVQRHFLNAVAKTERKVHRKAYPYSQIEFAGIEFDFDRNRFFIHQTSYAEKLKLLLQQEIIEKHRSTQQNFFRSPALESTLHVQMQKRFSLRTTTSSEILIDRAEVDRGDSLRSQNSKLYMIISSFGQRQSSSSYLLKAIV